MKSSVFKALCALVYDESGIRIKEGKQLMVSARLGARLRALELDDEEDYLAYLREHLDEELVQLLDVISTNVTHFFREAEHFDFLRKLLERRLVARAKRLRLWCAASSTGEEPYSLAMTVADTLATSGREADVRILATDISTRVLATASRGEYPAAALEPVSKAQRLRHFEPVKSETGALLRARPALRKLLVFRRLNLSEPPFPMKGPFDAIFCRNVMIYFDDAVRDPLLDEFRRLLAPDGLLVVGKSESLTRRNEWLERVGPSVYRPLGATARKGRAA